MEAGVEIRPLGSADRSAFEHFFDGLSTTSRYLRFFSPLPRLTKRTLDSMVEVDGRRHAAVAAWQGEELIGEARYVALDDQSAEVALSVRDDWQGRGVGSGMLLRVIAEAARNGVCRLTAISLAENVAVMRVLGRNGFVTVNAEDETLEWERDACPVPGELPNQVAV